jgi:hypothetical protein
MLPCCGVTRLGAADDEADARAANAGGARVEIDIGRADVWLLARSSSRR